MNPYQEALKELIYTDDPKAINHSLHNMLLVYFAQVEVENHKDIILHYKALHQLMINIEQNQGIKKPQYR